MVAIIAVITQYELASNLLTENYLAYIQTTK